MKRTIVIRMIAVLLCLTLFPVLPVAAQGTVALHVFGTENRLAEWSVLELLNAARAEEDLLPLQMDSVLMDAAMQRALELSVYYSHTRPNGTNGADIVEWRGAVGENVAAGRISAAEVMEDWLNSPAHRSNILSEKYRSVGIGVFETGGILYWVQLFDGGTPRAVQPTDGSVPAAGVVQTQTELLSLFTPQNTDVALQVGETFALGEIRNQNAGWDFASVVLSKEDLVYSVSDDSVVAVRDSVLTAVDCGTATVTVSVAGAPEALVAYTVTVTAEPPLPTTPSVQIVGTVDMAAAWAVLERVNAERLAAGVAPLEMDGVLLSTAMQRAAEVTLSYGHTRPDGSGFETAVEWRHTLGENLAAGYDTPDAAVNAWMDSQLHKENMLDPIFASAGVGVFTYHGQTFFALELDAGAPRPVLPTEEHRSFRTRINVAAPYVDLYANGQTDILLEEGKDTYPLCDIRTLNPGWNRTSVEICPEDLSGEVADPSVVRVTNGTLVPLAPGVTTVSVSIAGLPEVAVEYTVTVTARRMRTATINGETMEYAPGTTVDLPAAAQFYVENGYGYRFAGWSCVDASDGTAYGCISDPADPEAYFVMPDADVEITAAYYLIGDLDADGSVTSMDLLRLTRLLAGVGETSPAGDIDNDGDLNAADLVIMRRYIAGTYVPKK